MKCNFHSESLNDLPRIMIHAENEPEDAMGGENGES